jgi:type IV secretory pathway VirB10-like protein
VSDDVKIDPPEPAIAAPVPWRGVRRWVLGVKILLFAAMVVAGLWYCSHLFSRPVAVAATQTNSQPVDPGDLAPHTPAPLPTPTRTAKPVVQVAENEIGTTPPTPFPAQAAAAGPAPAQPQNNPPPPTSPPTASPAQLAAQKRAQEDQDARDAPLVVQPAAAGTQAQPPAQAQRANIDGADVPPPAGPYLERGHEIDVTLYTSIDSTVPGMITGFVGRDVLDYFQRVVLIPARSKIVGEMAATSLQPGQDRIGAIWEEIQLPNGHTIDLGAMPGIDLTGTSGFGATIAGHTGKLLTSVVAYSILAAGAQLVQPQNSGCSAAGYGCTPSVGQTIAQSVGSQIANLGASAYNRGTQIQPTAHVVEGAQVGVMVTRPLSLRPWNQAQ